MAETPADGLRVLVVDDDAGVRTSVVATVERCFDVVTDAFSRGSEAVAFAHQVPVAVAILDLDMPDLNGIEVARALRQAQPAIEIVFLTGSLGDFPPEDVASVQPKVVLSKPVTTAVLTDAVRRALGK